MTLGSALALRNGLPCSRQSHRYGYNWLVEIRIRRAKRTAQIAAMPPRALAAHGRGFLSNIIHLYAGWDSLAEDRKFDAE